MYIHMYIKNSQNMYVICKLYVDFRKKCYQSFVNNWYEDEVWVEDIKIKIYRTNGHNWSIRQGAVVTTHCTALLIRLCDIVNDNFCIYTKSSYLKTCLQESHKICFKHQALTHCYRTITIIILSHKVRQVKPKHG